MIPKLRLLLKKKAFVALLVCVVLLAVGLLARSPGMPAAKEGVAAGEYARSAPAMQMAERASRPSMAPAPVMAAMGDGEESAAPDSSAPWPTSPMVIRTASLDLRVAKVAEAQREIGRFARDAGGYIADATLQSHDEPETAEITIRVPNHGLDDMLGRIAGLGTLISKRLGAEEVTEEYVDLTSRRRNLEREELRLLDLLNRAGRVRDLLEVEQQVARVRGEIETITGRMRYLENRVTLSTVHVKLTGPEPPVRRGGSVWMAADVTRQALRSLLNTGRSFATIGIWLGVFLPIWLPVALVLLWWSRRNPPQPQPVQAPAVGPIAPGRP